MTALDASGRLLVGVPCIASGACGVAVYEVDAAPTDFTAEGGGGDAASAAIIASFVAPRFAVAEPSKASYRADEVKRVVVM